MGARLLVGLGMASMGIMLMHKYIILAVGMKLPFVRTLYASSLPVSIAVTGLVSALALMVSWAMTRAIGRYCPEVLGGRRK